MPLSSCDDDRLALARKAQLKLEEARALVKTGDYARALECYLFAFDNGLAVSSWGGVRLSYIPSEIASLGAKYPAARIALQVRRDAREDLIRAGETDYDVIAEWASINRYLDNEEHELDLLKELEKNGMLSNSLKKKIVDENFEQLLAKKEYRLLGEYFNDFGNRFMQSIFHYEEARIFPERYHYPPQHLDFSRRQIAKKGADLVELALSLGRVEQADGIVKRVLTHCNSADTYSLLISAAERAGKKRKTKDLAKQAKATLDKDEYRKFTHPDENSEMTFMSLLGAALEKKGAGNEKFDPALAFLAKQKGIEACLIARPDGQVIASKAPAAFDPKVIGLEIANIFRFTEMTLTKLNHSELQVVVLHTLDLYWVAYNLEFAILIILTNDKCEDLFSEML